MKNNNCLFVYGGGVERFRKSLFILFLVLSVLSFAACESRVDKFTRLMVQDYREHNVSDEELAAVYSKMSESEIEEAKMKIMREIGGDVFAGAFFNAPAKNSDVMNWREIGAVSASSADNKKITLSINIGYSDNIAFDDVAISDYLRQYIGRKNSDDFAPPNESKLKSDIRDSLNSDFFKSGKIRQVAIMDLSIK